MYFHELRPGDMFIYYSYDLNSPERRYVGKIELILSVVPVLSGTQICWWEVYNEDPGNKKFELTLHLPNDTTMCGDLVRDSDARQGPTPG